MFPDFFQLTPEQYRGMIAELEILRSCKDELQALKSGPQTARYSRMMVEIDRLRALLDDDSEYPIERVRYAWKKKQDEFPGSSRRFKAAIRQAFMRGHRWNILPGDYERLIGSPCYRCGGVIGKGVGLDRQNNKRGYELDNVKPCCGVCNIDRQRNRSLDRITVEV
jgi:hypothetical protein